MPGPDTVSYASGYGGRFSATGHVHMNKGVVFFVGKQGSHTGNFMNIVKNMLHWSDWFTSTLFRANDEPAALVYASDYDQCGSIYGMVSGELFNLLMYNIAVLETYNKGTSLFYLGIFHLNIIPPSFFGSAYHREKAVARSVEWCYG